MTDKPISEQIRNLSWFYSDGDLEEMAEKVLTMELTITKQQDALRFYANNNNYLTTAITQDSCGCCTTSHSKIREDWGKIAKQTLEAIEKVGV